LDHNAGGHEHETVPAEAKPIDMWAVERAELAKTIVKEVGGQREEGAVR
jgi:hypothetical protein